MSAPTIRCMCERASLRSVQTWIVWLAARANLKLRHTFHCQEADRANLMTRAKKIKNQPPIFQDVWF